MMRQPSLVTVGMLIVIATTAAMPVGTSRTTAQADPRGEVRAAWEGYLRAFSARQVEALADRHVMAPIVRILPDGPVAWTTPEQVRAGYESSMKELDAQGYSHTATKAVTICMMHDAAAIVSAQFTRYRRDGGVLSEQAGTYVFARTAGGWRIVTQMGHAADRIVKCGV